MEHLLDFLAKIVLALPSDYRTLMVLMIMATIMLVGARRISRASRAERLPLGASSPYFDAIILWLVYLMAFSSAALFFFHLGVSIGREAADAFSQAANQIADISRHPPG